MKLAELKKIKQRDLDRLPDKQKKTPKNDKLGTYAHFKLVGGPYHGNVCRMYAPWDQLVFESGDTYEVSPPIGASGEWVYIHTTEGEEWESSNTP